MANVISHVQTADTGDRPQQNLAAQLYQEFKSFFPENAVEYFVSYYDYYQPEAYIAPHRYLHRKGYGDQRQDRQDAAQRHPFFS